VVSVGDIVRAVRWCTVPFSKWPCLNDVCSFCFRMNRNEKDQEYCRYRNNPGAGDVSELYLATPSVR
jgi:hypothetical protein